MKAKDNDTLRRYVRERVKPELGLIEDLEEVEILEKCIERLRVKDRKDNHLKI